MEMGTFTTVMRFLFCVGILFQGCDSDVRCKNDDGKEVDWYILYKMPKCASCTNDPNRGLRYLYMDQSTNGWQLSNKMINSDSGTLANTLKPLFDYYDNKIQDFGFMLYSDQPPDCDALKSFGHSKGVVMLDRQTGVWLSHSTPRFPTYRSKVFWPNNGDVNAQTFMCVTFPYSDFTEIGRQLQYNHPFPFDSYFPQNFPSELRCVADKDRCYPEKEPWSRVATLKGQKFLSFAKYTHFGKDLYSDLIAPELKQDLNVQTWKRNGGPLPSDCSKPQHVYNVEELQLPHFNSFSYTKDHSKWCVTPNDDWTCIADINREESQTKRGGGALCINDHAVATAFRAIAKETEKCKKAPPPNPNVMNNLRPAGNNKKGKPPNLKNNNPPKLTPFMIAGKAAVRMNQKRKNAIALQLRKP